MKTLVLPVKRRWFDDIKSGVKDNEYRLDNEYWRKRLIGKTFDRVVVTLGYPPKACHERRLEFPWNGYGMETVISDEWGGEPRRVFAIRLIGLWVQEDDYPKWEFIDGAWWYDGACWPPEAVPEEIRNQPRGGE